MKYIFSNKNFFIILGIDIILLASSLYIAHLVRFDFQIPMQHLHLFYWILPFILVTKIVIFFYFDLYRGMWRFTSIADLLSIIKASTISTLIIVFFILFSPSRFLGFPRSVFVIDWCLTILLVAGFRLVIRVYFVHLNQNESWQDAAIAFWGLLLRKKTEKRSLLIVGAGNCGEKLYREIRDNATLHYDVVGFVDDDPAKIGRKIHGLPVLGPIKNIGMASKKMRADELLIAVPSANSQQMRAIVDHCDKCGVTFKTIPGMGELINGKVSVTAIREVAYRDLLGREVINLEENLIGEYIRGKSVLVTGAGGSIGSELCRQICRFKPQRIALYERAESALYEIDLEIRQNFSDTDVLTQLADTRDRKQLENAFQASMPQVVFHAAAYKHVPILEMQPWKAIKNNIQGTRNLVDFADRFDVERFVFVSTDKAVRPTNIMGASKRVAEMLVQGQNGCHTSNTRFMIVRFGNVVGSVGSVVRIFQKQIKNGGPVTVTHPDVTRFFMTIPEACQLILQAGAMGNGGEIYILEMGTPIKIDDMARDLIRLSGFKPDVDIKIKYIGLRPGEKLYEELITDGEDIIPTRHEKIMALQGAECNLQMLNGKIDELLQLSGQQAANDIKIKLKQIVPEYRPIH